jgi:hypothetical protein
MKFLCVYKPAKTESVPPTQEDVAEMGKLIEEGFREGWLLATEGCLPSEKGARVRLSNGKMTITDGPFSEAKELIGGFAIIQADSKAEVIELTKKFLQIAGDGESEIRQLYEPDSNVSCLERPVETVSKVPAHAASSDYISTHD